jgi:hypothetical protein
MRYDLFFNDFQIEEYVHKEICIPARNTIYSCHTNRDDSIGYPWVRLGDIFWYGESVSFDRVCDFYRFLPIIGERTFQKNKGTFVEGVFFHYAKMLRLSIKSLPLLDLRIFRQSNHLELKNKFGLSNKLNNCEII